jgi:UMF1 family MFS transporter
VNAARPSVLARLGLGRPELRAWAMYDWANSAVVAVVITTVFPIWYERTLAAGAANGIRDFGIATTAALLLSAVMGPVLGALGDVRPWKKRLLLVFQGAALLSTAALAFVPQAAAHTALVLFAVANVGASAAFVFYDALLSHVARDDELDRVSTAGYALGYVGGGLALALSLGAVTAHEQLGFASRDSATRASFLIVAAWWAVFSVPLFRRVPEPPVAVRPDSGRPLRDALVQLRGTFHELRRYRDAFTMMIAFLLYNDGIGAVIRLATIVGAERKFGETTMMGAILAVQFVGIPCAFAFGALAGRIGAKRSVFLALAVYAVVTWLAASMETETEFWVLALLVGAVQGGAQALSRSLFASMTPRARASEFFGLFGVFEKFAGIIGPALFTVVFASTGDSRLATLTVFPFFVVGALVLWRVDVGRGRAEARAADEAEAVSG